MAHLLASIPIFLILSVFQSVAVSRITFLSGSADIVLLAIVSWITVEDEGNYIVWAIIGGFFISILSAMPLAVTVLVYLAAALLTKLVHRLLWQSPILTIFLSTTLATVLKFFIEFIALKFMDIPSPFLISLGSILMPSLLLNIFLIFPVYIMMADIGNLISPKEDKYAG